MKPLSERDENMRTTWSSSKSHKNVGMKPLSERDENKDLTFPVKLLFLLLVGMKPLSERDENLKIRVKSLTSKSQR